MIFHEYIQFQAEKVINAGDMFAIEPSGLVLNSWKYKLDVTKTVILAHFQENVLRSHIL